MHMCIFNVYAIINVPSFTVKKGLQMMTIVHDKQSTAVMAWFLDWWWSDWKRSALLCSPLVMLVLHASSQFTYSPSHQMSFTGALSLGECVCVFDSMVCVTLHSIIMYFTHFLCAHLRCCFWDMPSMFSASWRFVAWAGIFDALIE